MIKLLSLFSGIGAFEKALDNLNIPFELVNYCEIDKYASKSYSAIHGVSEDKNLGDITKIDCSKLPLIDLVTYGFPCQDISLAGKQKGLFDTDGSLTRSGLFFEALKVIEHSKPKVAIAENVKALTSKKFKEQFRIVLESLELAGYNNYWKVLNAKDYGIPQNRERVFIVSIRKDIDSGTFEFPQPFQLDTRLKDLLEQEVNDKYYLSNAMVKYLTTSTDWQGSRNAVINKDIASTINTNEGTRRCDSSNYFGENLPDNIDLKILIHEATKIVMKNGDILLNDGEKIELTQVAQMYGTEREPNPQAGRVYDANGLSPTMDSCSGGNRMPKILESQFFTKDKRVLETIGKANFSEDALYLDVFNRNIIKEQTQALSEGMAHQQRNIIYDTLRIRKLTPKECFRLMGFGDEDFARAEKVNSNVQLYKQAGNSIVVNVLEYLFKNLLDTEVFNE